MVLGGREDVEDAAADGELAARLDHVDPGVGRRREPGRDVLQAALVPDLELDRLELAQAADDRLEQCPHRHDEHPDRAGASVLAGVREPPEDGDPPGHRVAARGEPLVRERLPRRQHRDVVLGQEVAQRGSGVVGLPTGRGDDHDGTRAPAEVGAGDRRDEGGAHPERDAHRALAAVRGGGDGLGEGGVGEERRDESGESHESWGSWAAQAPRVLQAGAGTTRFYGAPPGRRAGGSGLTSAVGCGTLTGWPGM